MDINASFQYSNTFPDLQQKIYSSSGPNTVVIAYGGSDLINLLQKQVDLKKATLIPAGATAMPLEGASNFYWPTQYSEANLGQLDINNKTQIDSIKRYADVNGLIMSKTLAAATSQLKKAFLYEGDIIGLNNNKNNESANEVTNLKEIGFPIQGFVTITNEIGDVCLNLEGNGDLFSFDALLASKEFRNIAKYYRCARDGADPLGYVKFYNEKVEELNIKATLATLAAAGYDICAVDYGTLNIVPTAVEMTANRAENCFRAAKYNGLL